MIPPGPQLGQMNGLYIQNGFVAPHRFMAWFLQEYVGVLALKSRSDDDDDNQVIKV